MMRPLFAAAATAGVAALSVAVSFLHCLRGGAPPLTGALSPGPPKPQPHLILLVLDDVGWGDISLHGSEFPTPHIDALLSTGVRFDRMYASPQCSPTRSSLMTGKWPWETGMQHWTTLVPGTSAGLPRGIPTLARMLKGANYSTTAIGKWHLGTNPESQTPLAVGFDDHYGILQGQAGYWNVSSESCSRQRCLYPINCASLRNLVFDGDTLGCKRPVVTPYGPDAAAYDFWDGGRLAPRPDASTTTAYQERFRQGLASRDPAKPFFAYYAPQSIHLPLELPDKSEHHLAKCRNVSGGVAAPNRTVLCAMASALDELVGDMEAALREQGMWDNTLLFVISDNGGMTAWTDEWPASGSTNWPLRGGKTTLYEGGTRVVAGLNGGGLPETRVRHVTQLLHAVDILPTFAHLAGAQVPAPVSGVNLWPAVLDDRKVRDELPLNIACDRDLSLFGHAVPGLWPRGELTYSAMIDFPWKIIYGHAFRPVVEDKRLNRSRGGRFTLRGYRYVPPNRSQGAFAAQLFNLMIDPEEQRDLAAEEPDRVDRLYAKLMGYLEAPSYVPPQFNLPRRANNPRFHNWTWSPYALGGALPVGA